MRLLSLKPELNKKGAIYNMAPFCNNKLLVSK